MPRQKIKLKVSSSDPEVAYLYLPKHPQVAISGLVRKQLRLADLINDYKGPDIYLDFDEEGSIIGMDIT
ncbi:DUF2283 domain-containing protein [Endozoicomonas arenosclerae]|uniref:DUF2283 domain-containing protein n=1 Tax=Endozoicomonas arenosclerae TaxID=1633495 RepID=UPI0007810DD2|nr:DUF2283 domain-containing protein [Endozoicomonas arenosclerae]